jgi:hypothetical protein
MPQPGPEILRGTFDLLILRALSWGPAHGYAIARWIERAARHATVHVSGRTNAMPSRVITDRRPSHAVESQIFTSWNPLFIWLRQVDSLQRAA